MSKGTAFTVRISVLLVLLVLICVYSLYATGMFNASPRVAFVAGGTDAFWEIAVAGARDSAKQQGVELEVRMPTEGRQDQDRAMHELMQLGVSGIAISPVNPAQQSSLLLQASQQVSLITHDSDAPLSGRLCYIGTDNYLAGQMCARQVKQALPGGGKVVIFIGSIEQDNGRLRRQGFIDELLDREPNPNGNDKPDRPVTNGKYTVLGTLTDYHDKQKARANADHALDAHADLGAMVGMFGYSGPICLEAVRAKNKLGTVKIVAFDENELTLKGVEEGHIHATIVQDPYRFGFHSVRLMAALAHDQRQELPLSDSIIFRCVTVHQGNVAEFRAKMTERRAAARQAD